MNPAHALMALAAAVGAFLISSTVAEIVADALAGASF